MIIVISFRYFACAKSWKSQKMGTTIGVKEANVSENGMMSSLRSVLKMHIITIGVITEVLAFMQI